jgi:translation initiation factor 2B subunit (eIF-2B alpha/beta/delta family)
VGDRMSEIRAAAADRESGSSEIAHRAAEALAALPRSDLHPAVESLIRGHPSMAPLWRLGSEVLEAEDHAAAARAFATRVSAEQKGVAARAAGLLSGTVLVQSYSGTAVAAVVAAGVRALCARSEPGGGGALTAARLNERGIEARVVEDEEAPDLAARVDAVLSGADAVGTGGVVNEAGTRRLAEAANNAGRPAWVVAGSSKLVGADLPAPLPFERIPMEAITAIVTEEGVLDPTEAARRAARFPLHPVLARLLTEMEQPPD